MGIFDKIFFWRKKEEAPAPSDLGLPKEEGIAPPDLGLPKDELGLPKEAAGIEHPIGPAAEPSFSHEPEPTSGPLDRPLGGFAPSAQPAQPPPMPLVKDIELISSKLDTLRATLDNINQRLANLERIAAGEHETY